jgi:hypothetical protein
MNRSVSNFFNVTGWIIAVLSALFAYYTYYDTRPSRYVTTSSTILSFENLKNDKRYNFFNKNNIDLQIKDQSIFNNAQFITIIEFRNGSNLEIEKTHILSDISFKIPEFSKIIRFDYINQASERNLNHIISEDSITISTKEKWFPEDGVKILIASNKIFNYINYVGGSIRNVKSIDNPYASLQDKFFYIVAEPIESWISNSQFFITTAILIITFIILFCVYKFNNKRALIFNIVFFIYMIIAPFVFFGFAYRLWLSILTVI